MRQEALTSTPPVSGACQILLLGLLGCGQSPPPEIMSPLTAYCPDGDCLDELISVPAGVVQMGRRGVPYAEPVHQVALGAFSLQRFEVSNASLSRFLRHLDDAGYSNDCSYGQTPAQCVRCDHPDAGLSCDDFEVRDACAQAPGAPADSDCAEHPATEVTWYGCAAYCAAAGGRMPSEAEWERAARGPDGAAFPWAQDCGPAGCGEGPLANCAEDVCADGFAGTSPRGSFPDGDSAEGFADLAGNAWEWVEDCWHWSYEGTPADGSAWTVGCSSRGQVLRGGSWFHGRRALRASARGPVPAPEGNEASGCRCAGPLP